MHTKKRFLRLRYATIFNTAQIYTIEIQYTQSNLYFRIIRLLSILPNLYVLKYTTYSGFLETRLRFIRIFYQILTVKSARNCQISKQYDEKPFFCYVEDRKPISNGIFDNYFTNWHLFCEKCLSLNRHFPCLNSVYNN